MFPTFLAAVVAPTKKLKFDFTVNIPTIITIVVILAGFVKWANDRYNEANVFVVQHKIMWNDYKTSHPGCCKFREE